MSDSPLNDALRHFEATEANLAKVEKVLEEVKAAIPSGIVFGGAPAYDDNCRFFDLLVSALPAIDGWKPETSLMSLDEIAQNRMDVMELGEFDAQLSLERQIDEPWAVMHEYRFRFDQKRRELIRGALDDLLDVVDACLRGLGGQLPAPELRHETVDSELFLRLKESVAQIHALLGSSVSRPSRWSDLLRHMHFRQWSDVVDIIEHDWPSVKAGLRKSMYGEKEAIPVGVEDLGVLAKKKPKGAVATRLLWNQLAEDDFERLIFALISTEHGYENPQWLTKTNAADRGRDLSVDRVHMDPLAGVIRQRVIIQCKHWMSRSIGSSEISLLRDQMKLWEPPRVDVHVIATSGRFTSDAVTLIERQNQSDSALRIEMWPESHLEYLLATRPAVIAQFGLR
jgi:hypothetical protein